MVFQVGFKIVQMGASSSLVKQVSEANTSSEKSSLLLFDYDQSKKTKFKDSLRILAAWSPYIILLYPGVLYWDTGDQVAQFFGISAFGQKRVKFGIIILSSIPIYTEDSFGLVVQLPAAIMWGFSYMP